MAGRKPKNGANWSPDNIVKNRSGRSATKTSFPPPPTTQPQERHEPPRIDEKALSAAKAALNGFDDAAAMMMGLSRPPPGEFSHEVVAGIEAKRAGYAALRKSALAMAAECDRKIAALDAVLDIYTPVMTPRQIERSDADANRKAAELLKATDAKTRMIDILAKTNSPLSAKELAVRVLSAAAARADEETMIVFSSRLSAVLDRMGKAGIVARANAGRPMTWRITSTR